MNIPATFNNLAIANPLQQNSQSQNFSRERPDTGDSRQQTRSSDSQSSPDFVYRGELLDAVDQQKRSRPQFNQQIPAQNRAAIERYLSSDSIENDDDPRGSLLDQYV